LCIPPIVARQRLGKHVPAATNACNNRRIIGRVISYAVRVLSKESLCIPLSLLVLPPLYFQNLCSPSLLFRKDSCFWSNNSPPPRGKNAGGRAGFSQSSVQTRCMVQLAFPIGYRKPFSILGPVFRLSDLVSKFRLEFVFALHRRETLPIESVSRKCT
jgi:hypothetical protein